jgi:predicted LPLAT superfamily acyltransferase/uncharacterized protein (DUF2062 family)
MPDSEDSLRPLCVIPVYNHAGTLAALVRGCREQVADVLVVDDGSTDADVPLLLAEAGATVLRHAANRGKGAALLTALAYAREKGFSHVITLDADGQHAPADLPRFLEALRGAPQALVVGVRDFSVPNVPGSSRFGRSFSNFWIALETGALCADTQCGYRAYPVGLVSQLRLAGRRYDFEVEILVRALWAGLPLVEVPVATWYAPPGERVSHFRKGLDNLRLSHTHAKLVGRRLLPWPAKRLLPRPKGRAWRELLHPAALIRRLLSESATPAGLGLSAGVGTFLAVLPIPWFHTVVIFYVATRLKLNRVMALAIQNLFAPPFTPALCIALGHLLLTGEWLPRLPRSMGDLCACLLEWLVGSLLVAPVFAVVSGVVVCKAAERLQAAKRAPRAGEAARRGNALGFWFFRAALRLTGLRGAYGLLYFVCAYYAAFDRAAVAGADAYLRRRFPGRSRLARRFGAYRLFIQQGKCLIDRHAHNAGARAFAFDGGALEEVCAKLGAGGYVLLLAHAGGWQLALPSLRRMAGERPVSLLMRAAETADVRRHVRGDDAGFHVIPPESGPGCVVEMVARLQRGEIVSIMGDRAYGGQTAAVPFLGEEAHFPVSAFAVARAAQCPVVALFVPKVGVARYRIEPVLFEAPAREDRQAVRRGVAAFAGALEAFTRRHPYQCFLFSDIWAGG